MVGRPTKEDSGATDNRLFPRECREAVRGWDPAGRQRFAWQVCIVSLLACGVLHSGAACMPTLLPLLLLLLLLVAHWLLAQPHCTCAVKNSAEHILTPLVRGGSAPAERNQR